MHKGVTCVEQLTLFAGASLHSSSLTRCCSLPSQPSMSMLFSGIIFIVFLFSFSSANLPPPVSREQLGARILAQERYEQLQVFKIRNIAL